MKMARWLTLTALAFVMGACQDAPTTLPEPEPDSGAAGQATALDQAAAQLADAAPRPQDRTRVELAVALGGESVELAARLLERLGADREQQRLLAEATGLQRRAQAALEAGEDARATRATRAAEQTALKAVVLPGGITTEELRLVRATASGLLRRARAAAEASPTGSERPLLATAQQLFREGSARLEGGRERGLPALWKSAAISSWLIG